MSFTYTVPVGETFGTMRLSKASMYLKSSGVGTKNQAKLIFDSNVSVGAKMSVGADETTNSLRSSNVFIAPNFKAESITGKTSNGVLTTDANGFLQQSSGFTYSASTLEVPNARITGDLTVGGKVTILDTSTVLIEDPIVQVGMSNIMASQEVGFIFTANNSSLGSNVCIGFVPSSGASGNVFVIGQTYNSANQSALNVEESGNLAVQIYGTLNVTKGITQNGSPLASLDDITLELAIQNSNYETDSLINFHNGITSNSVSISSISGVNRIDSDVLGNIRLGVKHTGTTVVNSNVLVLNEHGGVVDSGMTIAEIASAPGGSSNLQTVMTTGDSAGRTSETMFLDNTNTALDVAGNVFVRNELYAGTVISNGLNSNTAAFNIVLANQLQVADIYADGQNINFYGPAMNVSGNITAQSFTGNGSALTNVPTVSGLQTVTTNGATTSTAVSFTNSGVAVSVPNGSVQANGVLASTLDVTGSATFNGVTTVSVLKFTPGGVDPDDAPPAVAQYTGITSNIININMTGVTYGSNTVTNAVGNVNGLSVTGLAANAHLYLYVNGTQTFVTPTDGYTYLSKALGLNKVVYHVFKIGGTTFVDMTSVN